MAIKTIGEVTREYLDEAAKAALAKFRDAVKPIYGATERGAPDHIGTALLLELPEGRFLLTAAHVIDHNCDTSLYLGAGGFAILQFEALVTAAPDGKRASDHADFAIARLDDEFVGKLSNTQFITGADISRSVAPAEGRTYTCLGYPNSKNKLKPLSGVKITPKLLPYTSTGKPTTQLPKIARDEFHILVDYNAKYVRDEDGNKVSATDMHGCSGGAIIDLGRISPDSIGAPFEPKLAALFIEGHRAEKVIVGTRLSAILAGVRQHLKLAEAQPDMATFEKPS
ncbi:hypothetical protein CN213_06210 [Sinorhizobium meliloti]|uniref:hypothetical protein n=1 Tax=Rhizobium meliloti TaxID=382 RepID=UPI000FD9FAAA|nr:hypothetical protein [Sinorhizobium meliloti]RVH60095.1 hypothetical protein CN213_06210 [Sinorhizobium meliloti]